MTWYMRVRFPLDFGSRICSRVRVFADIGIMFLMNLGIMLECLFGKWEGVLIGLDWMLGEIRVRMYLLVVGVVVVERRWSACRNCTDTVYKFVEMLICIRFQHACFEQDTNYNIGSWNNTDSRLYKKAAAFCAVSELFFFLKREKERAMNKTPVLMHMNARAPPPSLSHADCAKPQKP